MAVGNANLGSFSFIVASKWLQSFINDSVPLRISTSSRIGWTSTLHFKSLPSSLYINKSEKYIYIIEVCLIVVPAAAVMFFIPSLTKLGELKLGELLDTPPPGLDEAIAISKVCSALVIMLVILNMSCPIFLLPCWL